MQLSWWLKCSGENKLKRLKQLEIVEEYPTPSRQLISVSSSGQWPLTFDFVEQDAVDSQNYILYHQKQLRNTRTPPVNWRREAQNRMYLVFKTKAEQLFSLDGVGGGG